MPPKKAKTSKHCQLFCCLCCCCCCYCCCLAATFMLLLPMWSLGPTMQQHKCAATFAIVCHLHWLPQFSFTFFFIFNFTVPFTQFFHISATATTMNVFPRNATTTTNFFTPNRRIIAQSYDQAGNNFLEIYFYFPENKQTK